MADGCARPRDNFGVFGHVGPWRHHLMKACPRFADGFDSRRHGATASRAGKGGQENREKHRHRRHVQPGTRTPRWSRRPSSEHLRRALRKALTGRPGRCISTLQFDSGKNRSGGLFAPKYRPATHTSTEAPSEGRELLSKPGAR